MTTQASPPPYNRRVRAPAPAALALLGLMAVALAAPWTARAEAGFDACLDAFPARAVPAPRTLEHADVCKTVDGQALFAVRFDTPRKIPAWTAHALTPEEVSAGDANAGAFRRPKFKPDPELPGDNQAIDASYVNSGYQRGHLVPADDMSWSRASYDATFVLSNAVPQLGTFNNGTWRGLEDEVRTWVADKAIRLWIIAGTYGARGTIGQAPNTPAVPRCFYKIVVARPDPDGPFEVLATVFAWDDARARKDWRLGVTTLDTVRARSGIDFLDGLDLAAGPDATAAAFWGVQPPAAPADCP